MAPGVNLTILGYHHKPTYLLKHLKTIAQNKNKNKNSLKFSVSSHLLDIKFKIFDIWLTKMFFFSVSQTSFHTCHIFLTQTFWLALNPCINASTSALKVIMMCQNSLNQQESTKMSSAGFHRCCCPFYHKRATFANSLQILTSPPTIHGFPYSLCTHSVHR